VCVVLIYVMTIRINECSFDLCHDYKDKCVVLIYVMIIRISECSFDLCMYLTNMVVIKLN
jgi:hypothetical protein